MWKVFKISKEENSLYEKLLRDETTSKLSITKRDSQALGLDGDHIYIIVEGEEEKIKKASEILYGKEVEEKEAKLVYKIYLEQLENAQRGVGFIFGE